jgi:hypothetical protein
LFFSWLSRARPFGSLPNVTTSSAVVPEFLTVKKCL